MSRPSFGRRPYISPRVRRARRNARIAAAVLLSAGLLLSLGCYAALGAASHEYGQRYGDLAGLGMLAGMAAFGCFAVAVIAATEA